VTAPAYGNHDASLLLQMIGMTPTPEAYGYLQQYTAQIKERLQPYLTGGVYMSFLEGEESQQHVNDGYAPELLVPSKQLSPRCPPSGEAL
jgi:hypothetical protein